MTTLKSIAEDLDVSVSLVSKVLNNKLGTTAVRPELQKAIVSHAKQVGYRKNAAALALHRGRQGALAVHLFPHGTRGSGIAYDLLYGLANDDVAGQRLLLRVFSNLKTLEKQLRDVHVGVVDGLIVGGVYNPNYAPLLLAKVAEGLPVITIMRRPVDEAIPNVGADEHAVGRIAGEHLIAMGCRRLLVLDTWDERTAGCRDAATAHGVDLQEVKALGFYRDHGADATAAAFAAGMTFDGLVAQSDEQALGAMAVMREHGLSMPGDVRVIGVDDSPLCQTAAVPLSSVSQGVSESCATALQMMEQAVAGKAIESVQIRPRIVVRASTDNESIRKDP